MSAKQNTKLIPHAARLFDKVMDEMGTIFYTCEEQYHILRYLTNMLEAEEEKIWKQINKI